MIMSVLMNHSNGINDRKEYMHQYQLKHKEKIKEYKQQYFQENKDEIIRQRNNDNAYKQYQTEYRKQKIDCCCGKTLLRGSIYIHRKKCVEYQQQNK
jgi:hypothetical protein